MTQRVAAAFDHLVDMRTMTDEAVVARARNINIDIAIDLAGYTLDARTGVFARRAAPVQVNYLGHPGTLGVPFYDYIIADEIVIPEADRLSYVEKPVYLPNSFQVNDSRRDIAPATSRARVGLPEDAVVLCSFNNSYKINARVFDAWLAILKALPAPVLWLIGESETQMKNLRAYAARQGIDDGRIIFAPRVAYTEHLARYQLADLVLDTLPFNGGATTSDALWAGVPVLTCLGTTYAGRMAGSLLRAVGLPEMITTSLTAYQALAIELVQNRQQLTFLRQKLASQRLTAPLFDTALFTRHIEAAYTQMHQRYLTGLPPEVLRISGAVR